MPDPAKFVQIAVTAGGVIYALDEVGAVWRFDPPAMGAAHATWTRLSSHRSY